MSRIAIVGSCISRDLSLAPSGEVKDLLYVARTSLPSLLSTPVPSFRPAARPPEPLRPFQHAAMVADLTKTALRRLVAFRPTTILFDFIDERFDLLAVAGGLVTRSWELEASGYLRQASLRGARVIPRLSSACERLWRDAAVEFAELVQATPLRNARLVLHSAQWATVQRDVDGGLQPLTGAQVLEGQPADVGACNAMLTRYETTFRSVMPPMAEVAAPELRIADRAHRWGASPFHYVPEYYAEIRRQLAELGVDAFSPPCAAPSAPAA